MKKVSSANNKISKLYIANRGEIALRIQRTARRLGIACCVGISEADRELSFARDSQETVIIGPAAATESYLHIDWVIEAALSRGCDAVHPGYGFLSENHHFAERVMQAGMIWVGPSPESIRLMGSKVEGRKRALEAKVPTVPGTPGGLSDKELIIHGKKTGFPLIIKAVGGGGGRGMRVIRSAEELVELLPRARSEALKNFGDENIFLERFIERPRHVEVQLLGDQHGNLVHLGTRDCSVQRRHQKLIEEAPAPFLTAAQREAIHRAAVAAARSVGYYSTGTAEFLVEGRKFYFLEMNTRIQVEHPVTESITGLDLVEQQLLVAQGEKLSFTQKKVKFSGHAIEFRINAEDASTGFTPTAGLIEQLELPAPGEAVRADMGFSAGDTLGLFYDGLVGKIIVSGATRRDAMRRSVQALREFRCAGLQTNHDFHRWIIRTRIFNEEGVDIAFVGREFSAECLGDLVHAEQRDPSASIGEHLEGYARMTVLAVERDRSKRAQPATIDILERADGTFIASCTARGKNKKPLRVASNSRKTAIRELLKLF